MKRKVLEIANTCAMNLSSLKNIRAVLLSDTFEIETYDPCFSIEIDAYFFGSLPAPEERKKLFGNPSFFESPPVYPVDRFLVDNLPININYKQIDRINDIFRRIAKHEWVFRKATTNVLHRLKHGTILYNKDNWILTIRKRFSKVPADFWQNILLSATFLIEYYYRELSMAAVKGNDFLYQVALANFFHSVCGYVFGLNKEFEPSPRSMIDRIRTLRSLPDEFITRFEILLHPGSDYPIDRKCEVARLIASSLIQMK